MSPELLASLAVLITAISGLVYAIRGHTASVGAQQQGISMAATLSTIQEQTNGNAQALQQRIDLLETVLTEMRTLGLTPRTMPAVPQRRSTDQTPSAQASSAPQQITRSSSDAKA